jgi:pyrroloquinoline quinone (PQQ) biosynthesis protein C
MNDRRDQLLALYEEFPFESHPLWRSIISGELSYEEVIRAEVQHWIRTRAGQLLRAEAVEKAEASSAPIFELLLETYLEECTDKKGPNHLGLIERLVTEGGYTRTDLEQAVSTPGNSAAIALYRDIGIRGPGCHMLGAGAVEFFYSQLSPSIFNAYTQKYGMTAHQAETYKLHGPMDRLHAERAFAIIDQAEKLHGWETVRMSVRDAFVATSLHYDGMLHAATGTCSYWNGRTT